MVRNAILAGTYKPGSALPSARQLGEADAELQAAMRTYWSAYADAPQWAIWVLFAGIGRSETLMGTMFDTAFQRFAAAFEKRADAVYGKPGAAGPAGAN